MANAIEPRYLKLDAACVWLGVGRTTLKREIAAGSIRPARFRGALRIAVRELERYAKACEGKPRQKAVGAARR